MFKLATPIFIQQYGIMAIWVNFGHMAIWPCSYMAMWQQMWPIWMSMEQAVEMQQSSDGIKSIGPSYEI
jgi:hypothetical protein